MMPQDPSKPNEPGEGFSNEGFSGEDLLRLEESEYCLAQDLPAGDDLASGPLWFADLLDGRLDPEQARIREAALDEDAGLKQRYDLYASTVQKMRSLGKEEARESASPFLKARILASIQAEKLHRSSAEDVPQAMGMAPVELPEKARGRGVFVALVASTGLAAAALLGMLYILEQSPKKLDLSQESAQDLTKEESSTRLDDEDARSGFASRSELPEGADELAKAPGSPSASKKTGGGSRDFVIGRGRRAKWDLPKAIQSGVVDFEGQGQGQILNTFQSFPKAGADKVLLFAVELAPQQAAALAPQIKALEEQRYAFSMFAAGMQPGRRSLAAKGKSEKSNKKQVRGPQDAVPVITGGGGEQKWGRQVPLRDLYGPEDYASTSNRLNRPSDEVVVLKGPEDQLMATLALLFQRSERHAIAFVPKASLTPVQGAKQSFLLKMPKVAEKEMEAKRKAAKTGRAAGKWGKGSAPGKPDKGPQAGRAADAKRQDTTLEIRVLILKQRHPVPGRSGRPATPSLPTPKRRK